jgi:hypothetical protein
MHCSQRKISHRVVLQAWINEFHYENVGTDDGEFIEVAVSASTNLSGWTIYYYNGNNGESYATSTLIGVGPSSGVSVVSVNQSGIQNGGSDGIALVDNSNNVVQFLSYEGTVTALNGPASGMISTNVGVLESSSTPIGYSLQLAGRGCSYDDFSWRNPASNTKGSVNNGQIFECQSTATPSASPLDSNMLTAASGYGTLTSSGDLWVLPAGIADIFVDVESSSDLDFELFDGSTTIVGAGGLLSSK